jgi:sterol desaturase/sphingolipid hydroxylase (fatty acid hydroxylase superfamily)
MMLISLIVTASVVALLERFARARLRPQPFLRAFFVTDLFYLLTGFIAGGSIAVAYVTRSSQFIGEVFSLPRLAAVPLPLWSVVILALLALDAGNYAAHYCLHRFEVLWEFHKVHHSSRELDWLATFRSHIGEQVLRRLLAPVLLILFGFPLNAVVIAGAIFIAWGIFNHANVRFNLRFLEKVFITPRLHRTHHLNHAPVNNLGTFFTFWDKLRGTLDRTEIADGCEFGNGEPDYPQSWLRQFLKPLTVSRLGRN